MDAPRRPDGPPVKNGKPYSQIAHLAETVVPFVAMAKALRAQGLSAPDIQHADLQQGLLVIEDLGTEGVVAGDPPAPIVERYETAVDALLALHGKALPAVLPVAPHVEHEIPPYDMDALLIEVELLLEWYLPRLGIVVTDDARADFFGHWRDALKPVLDAPPTWTLRDYHSPNLLWLPDREEIARLGVLDFQDAVMGPPAYDLASLAAGRARRRAGSQSRSPLLGRYVRQRRTADRRVRSRHLHPQLRHDGGATRDQDPRYLRAPRHARRQAAIFASHPADIGLSATLARASRARAAERVVQPPCPGVKVLTIRKHL